MSKVKLQFLASGLLIVAAVYTFARQILRILYSFQRPWADSVSYHPYHDGRRSPITPATITTVTPTLPTLLHSPSSKHTAPIPNLRLRNLGYSNIRRPSGEKAADVDGSQPLSLGSPSVFNTSSVPNACISLVPTSALPSHARRYKGVRGSRCALRSRRRLADAAGSCASRTTSRRAAGAGGVGGGLYT